MTRILFGVLACCVSLSLGCATETRDPAVTRGAPGAPAAAAASLFTDLSGPSCAEEVDKSDPNETPYLSCPGVGGYRLIVRRVESGRRSVDVVDAAGRQHPLAFPATVTPDMSTLRAQAEWRVTTVDGPPVPIALIIGVEARENLDTPELVTRTLLAIAKIAADESCVVESLVDGTRTDADVRRLADSARSHACKPREPK